MLRIIIPLSENFDEETETFSVGDSIEFDIEHSLASLSKWESKYEKPFLSEDPKTLEETLDYVKIMTLTPEVPDDVYRMLDAQNVRAINAYINAKMTATTVHEVKTSTARPEQITAELIYYWMTAFQIPFECEHWHLNRLMMLIKVINRKNEPPKKMSRADLARKHQELNAQRKAAHNTSG